MVQVQQFYIHYISYKSIILLLIYKLQIILVADAKYNQETAAVFKSRWQAILFFKASLNSYNLYKF